LVGSLDCKSSPSGVAVRVRPPQQTNLTEDGLAPLKETLASPWSSYHN